MKQLLKTMALILRKVRWFSWQNLLLTLHRINSPLEKPWAQLRKINVYLICLVCMLIGFSVFGAWAWYQFYFSNYKHILAYLYFIPSISLIILGLFIFFRLKGNRIYRLFLQDIEEKNTNEQSQTLAYDSLRVLRKFLFYSDLRWITIAFLVVSFAFITIQVRLEISRLTLKKPDNLPKQVQKNILKTSFTIQKIETTLKNNKTLLDELKVRMLVNQKTILFTKNSIQEQYNAYYQASAFRNKIRKFEIQIAQLQASDNHFVSNAEAVLRADAQIFQQIKGMVEVQLFLEGKEENEATQILSKEGNLLKSFQDLIAKYEYQLNKAFKSIQRDTQKIKELQEEISKDSELNANIHASIAQDSIFLWQSQQNIQKFSQQLNKK